MRLPRRMVIVWNIYFFLLFDILCWLKLKMFDYSRVKIPESPHLARLPGWMCNLKRWWTNHLIRDNKDQKSSSKSRILSSGRNSAEPFTAWLKAISKIFYIVKYRDTGLGDFWCPWKPFCGHENVERGMSLAGIEAKKPLLKSKCHSCLCVCYNC